MNIRIYGKLTTCAWKLLPTLRASFPNVFVVKVCNTARGESWDYPMVSAVYPSWDMINRYNKRKHYADRDRYWDAFKSRYIRQLDDNRDEILADFAKVVYEAKGRLVALCCHEETGHCHRYILERWLFDNGAYNAIMNRDTIMCANCYNAYAEDMQDAWTEREENLIMGYTFTQSCDDCSGEAKEWYEEEDGIYEFGRDY